MDLMVRGQGSPAEVSESDAWRHVRLHLSNVCAGRLTSLMSSLSSDQWDAEPEEEGGAGRTGRGRERFR